MNPGTDEKKEKEKRKVQDVLNLFDKEDEFYCIVTEFLNLKLQDLFPQAQSIETRVKSRASIAGKVMTKYAREKDSLKIYRSLGDLSGGRIIFLHRSELDAADRIIRDEFIIDDRNSQDTAERLNTKEFGYLSKHYAICLDWDFLEKEKERLFQAINLFLCKKNSPAESAESLKEKMKDFFEQHEGRMIFAELQSRTCLQHVWAELEHDHIYKGRRTIPRELLRFWHALAAVLEHADTDIEKTLEQLTSHLKNKPYYTEEELQAKINRQEIIAEVLLNDNSCPKEKKKSGLAVCKSELQALYQLNAGGNTKLLEEISRVSGISDTPQNLLLQLQKDLTNPQLLLTCICQAKEDPDLRNNGLRNTLKTVSYIYGAGIRRCEEMINSYLELPWAFAGKAFFKLLLLKKHPEENTDDNISDIYDSILRLIDLSNTRSVANLSQARPIATPDSRNALAYLQKAICSMSWARLNKSDNGRAPLIKCVKLLLELGIYAHNENEQKLCPKNPQVIIAGGCGSLDPLPALTDFRKFFDQVIDAGSNRITFYTGSGKSGICSLNLERKGNTVKRFGIKTDSDEGADKKSPYTKNTIYEALMQWHELKRRSYRFDQIALVGFGLGRISDLECRTALAFGARVTVIGHKSFLSYKRTFQGIPYWSSHPSLVELPPVRGTVPRNGSFDKNPEKNNEIDFIRTCGFPEPVMLRTFMLFKPFRKEDYKDNDVFTMLLHRIRQLMISKHPKDEKDSVKRCSAHHRKLCFLELYRDAHGGKAPELPPLAIPEDTSGLPAVLEQLHKDAVRLTPIDYAFGEREHARWYIERWLQGTRYGDNKIDKNIPPEQRTNPCMLSWYDLEEDIILRDTEFLPRYQVAKAIEKCDRLLQAVNTVFTDF